MSTLTIHTNNVPRNTLNWFELTPKEQKEFDYLDTEDRQMDASFLRYKGQIYDLGEFIRVSEPMKSNCQFKGVEKWDGYSSDSFFSGILIKYVNDYEQVIPATYFS
jgi:hypothetical protein